MRTGANLSVEKPVREHQGAFFSSLTAGDASTKFVVARHLHPKEINSFASFGQA